MSFTSPSNRQKAHEPMRQMTMEIAVWPRPQGPSQRKVSNPRPYDFMMHVRTELISGCQLILMTWSLSFNVFDFNRFDMYAVTPQHI